MRLACSGMVTRATEIPTTARRVSVASYCRTDDDEAKYNLGHKGCKASFYRHFAPLRTTETLLSITSLHFTIFQHRKGNRNANTFSASIMADGCNFMLLHCFHQNLSMVVGPVQLQYQNGVFLPVHSRYGDRHAGYLSCVLSQNMVCYFTTQLKVARAALKSMMSKTS